MKIENLNILTQEVIEYKGNRFIRFNELKDLGVRHIMTTKDFDTGVSTCNDDVRLKSEFDDCIKIINSDANKVLNLHQAHSDITVIAGVEGEIVEKDFAIRTMNVDGLMTNEKGIPLSIGIADCVPVVLYDVKNKAISNIHSGWKGTFKEIAPKALEKMIKVYNTNPEDVKVFIGPHIGFNDFEVTLEVESQFKEKFGEIEDLIRVKDSEHFIIDLTKVISYGLIKKGVKVENIYASLESTVSNPDLYHSFRRDGKKFGGMSLVVEL